VSGRLVKFFIITCLLFCAIGLSTTAAWSIERFPPPDFTDHAVPETHFAHARAWQMQYVDLGVLVVALLVATYFAIGIRRELTDAAGEPQVVWRGRSRVGLLAVMVFSIIYFGFIRHGCICPIGSIQNVALAVGDSSYRLADWTLGFFVLPLVIAFFCGRTFCSSVCPLGGVQELFAIRPIHLPRWLDESLGLVRWIYLGLAVALAATGTTFLICRYDPFVAIFRMGGSWPMLAFGGGLLLVGIFIGRPYCRFLCPYGALLGLCSRVAKYPARITPRDCIECHLCEKACPYGAIREPSLKLRSEHHPRVRRHFFMMLGLLPVLVFAIGYLGYRSEALLSQYDFTTKLAQQVLAEQTGEVEGTTDETDTFYASGIPLTMLYQKAAERSRTFQITGALLGAWTGLIIALKLIEIGLFRHRADYHVQPSKCVACGRCFDACPVHREHAGKIDTRPVPLDIAEKEELS
jgi:NosR/NirI family transcriptional regulator, nitrous oxide reductase regulator